MIESKYNVKYPLQLAICTKSTELFEPYSKEKVNFFLKLLFIKVNCLMNFNKIFGFLRNG